MSDLNEKLEIMAVSFVIGLIGGIVVARSGIIPFLGNDYKTKSEACAVQLDECYITLKAALNNCDDKENCEKIKGSFSLAR